MGFAQNQFYWERMTSLSAKRQRQSYVTSYGVERHIVLPFSDC